MQPEEYKLMYQVETTHWWYRGMESITRALLKQYIHTGPDRRILDAGCGTGGAITNFLGEYGRVTGFDLSMIALGYCSLRNIQSVTCASVEALPYAGESFDLVTSFDVLYEQGVSNDSLVISEFFRVLVRGGHLLIRLPAYDWLRGRHDRMVHTARRYTSRQVTRLLQDSGFIMEHVSYANMFLYPPALIKRLMEWILPSKNAVSDLSLNMGLLNGLLRAILSFEAPWVGRTGLPFGLSVFAVGRKI
jgi:SAM-dependent methyltransferase